MTTIAWDGHTLAADRQVTFFGTPIPTTKVFKVRAPNGSFVLYGCAGKSDEIAAFNRWIAGKQPDRPELSELNIIAIDQERRIWCALEKLNWFQVQSKVWSIGSGADYALGAMYFGASATKAVEIASLLDTSTGFGIDAVTF